MTTISIPVTTYTIRSEKPDLPYGSPAAPPVQALNGGIGGMRCYTRVPMDRVPSNATISSAILRVYSDRASTGAKNTLVWAVTGDWTSGVTWNTQPSCASPSLASVDFTNPALGHQWDLDVTTWAQTRSLKGVRLDSSSIVGHFLRGSSGASLQPMLIVTYTVTPLVGGNLVPNGGSVSVDAPILTYTGDPNMTQHKIQFSNDGINVSYDSGWFAATIGYYDPAGDPGANPVLTNGGAGIYWRAITNGAGGQSAPTAWAYYEYDVLPTVEITAPGATAADGSPPMTWTVSTNQSAWKATFLDYSTGATIDSHAWANETGTRGWTPSKGIVVPNGTGRFTVEVADQIAPRRAAVNAPTTVTHTHDFTTVLSGAGGAIDTIGYTFSDPIPTIIGTRAAGIPDEISLIRDGVMVPVWDPTTGTMYSDWAPGTAFFSGTNFAISDYTVASRGSTEYTWNARTRVNGTISAVGPSVARTPRTYSAWLVDPRTGTKVEIQGYGDLPVIDQATEENAILHTPVNQGLMVEPKRRRLVRSTRSGSVSGVVLDTDEDTLREWVETDSSVKYRLIFGKVNWPVIIGDYSPSDVLYPDVNGPDRVLVSLNWWQRLVD